MFCIFWVKIYWFQPLFSNMMTRCKTISCRPAKRPREEGESSQPTTSLSFSNDDPREWYVRLRAHRLSDLRTVDWSVLESIALANRVHWLLAIRAWDRFFDIQEIVYRVAALDFWRYLLWIGFRSIWAAIQWFSLKPWTAVSFECDWVLH